MKKILISLMFVSFLYAGEDGPGIVPPPPSGGTSASSSNTWTAEQTYTVPMIWQHKTTPGVNPDFGYVKVYAKADNQLYTLDFSGVERRAGRIGDTYPPTTDDIFASGIWSPSSDNKKALVLQGHPTQNANIFELQNSAGNVLTYFNSLGRFYTQQIEAVSASTLNINAFDAVVLNDSGGSLALTSGTGSGTGDGGYLSFYAGASGSGATGTGGAIELITGGSNATNGNGGGVDILTGSGNGTGNGGSVEVTTGASGPGLTGDAGAITLFTGGASSTNGSGGYITLLAGTSTGTGVGAPINVTAGSAFAGLGGDVNVTGGNSVNNTAGNVLVTGGNSTNAVGGNVRIRGGTGTTAGDIILGDLNTDSIIVGVPVSSPSDTDINFFSGNGTGGGSGGNFAAIGGSGDNTGAGGSVSLVGGASGVGASGFGGAAAVTGGTSASAGGVGGEASITGGFASVTGNHGSVKLNTGSFPRQLIRGSPFALTDATTATIATFTISTLRGAGARIEFTVEVANASEVQSCSGVFRFNAVNKAGTFTTDPDLVSSTLVTGGTLAVTFSFTNAGDNLNVRINSDTDLTSLTRHRVFYTVYNDSGVAFTIP